MFCVVLVGNKKRGCNGHDEIRTQQLMPKTSRTPHIFCAAGGMVPPHTVFPIPLAKDALHLNLVAEHTVQEYRQHRAIELGRAAPCHGCCPPGGQTCCFFPSILSVTYFVELRTRRQYPFAWTCCGALPRPPVEGLLKLFGVLAGYVLPKCGVLIV